MENEFSPVPPGMHQLPPLPYPYDAMEPVIDAETMRIHHDKHHRRYVDDLNKAELALAEARKQGDYAYIKYWENELAFNGSGHILHSVFWTILARPGTGGAPMPYTAGCIDSYFGGFDAFQAQFSNAAKKVEGSGWCVLGLSPSFFRLELLTAGKHQDLTQWGIIPILVLDVWEHAYYLRYQNNRDAYVDAWWRLVNWAEAENRLLRASQGILPMTMGRLSDFQPVQG